MIFKFKVLNEKLNTPNLDEYDRNFKIASSDQERNNLIIDLLFKEQLLVSKTDPIIKDVANATYKSITNWGFKDNPFLEFMHDVGRNKLVIMARNNSDRLILLVDSYENGTIDDFNKDYLQEPSLYNRSNQEFMGTVKAFEIVTDPQKLKKYFNNINEISVDDFYEGNKIKSFKEIDEIVQSWDATYGKGNNPNKEQSKENATIQDYLGVLGVEGDMVLLLQEYYMKQYTIYQTLSKLSTKDPRRETARKRYNLSEVDKKINELNNILVGRAMHYFKNVQQRKDIEYKPKNNLNFYKEVIYTLSKAAKTELVTTDKKVLDVLNKYFRLFYKTPCIDKKYLGLDGRKRNKGLDETNVWSQIFKFIDNNDFNTIVDLLGFFKSKK